MLKLKDITTIISEVGPVWVFCRLLYAAKLKLLSCFPMVDLLFEKKTAPIKRLDIFDVDTKGLEAFFTGLSESDKNKLVSDADNILNGKIKLFANMEVDYGNTINWKYNPLSNRCYSDVKWFKIPDFDEEYGDVKATWEINRFSYVWFLMRAYIITKNKKYYEKVKDNFISWNQNNKYSYGPNYKCGQECSLRILNVLAAFGVFNSYGIADNEFTDAVLTMVANNQKKIKSNFFYAKNCVKTDHLISELCGLIVCAWCTEDEKEKEKFFAILDKEIQLQFNINGLYESFSLNYQRYVLQLCEYMLHISDRCKLRFSKASLELLAKASQTYMKIAGENGSVPNYGANDGTFIFPVGIYSNYLSTANAMINLLSCEPEETKCNEEQIWFGNESLNKTRLESLEKENPFLTLKNNNAVVYLNSHTYSRRPGHMDQLHIDFWLNGKNIFCDCGSFSYTKGSWDELRTTRGHNTVFVTGKEQMKCLGRFLVYGKPKIISAFQTEKQIESEQKFYTGYRHCRNIHFEEQTMVVVDRVSIDDGTTEYKVLFHTPYKIKYADQDYCMIDVPEVGDIKVKSGNGTMTINKIYMSRYYLDRIAINEIEILCKEAMHKTVIEVL